MKTGGTVVPASLPQREGLCVMAVERIKRAVEKVRQVQRVEDTGFAPTLFRHPGSDVFPQVTEFRHVAARNVVGDRHTGQFDDAALYRVLRLKSLTVHGNSVPSTYPEPLRKNGVAERS